MSDPLDFLNEPSIKRSSSPNKTPKPRPSQEITKWILGFLFLFGIIVVFPILLKTKDPNKNLNMMQANPLNNNKVESTRDGPKIEYKMHKQWSLGQAEQNLMPGGGFGKVIIIDPKDCSIERLRALGDQLLRETQHSRNAFIFIYDDLKAAQLRDDIPLRAKEAEEKDEKRLPHESDADLMRDSKYSSSHFIAEYTRNGNSGYHKLEIHLKEPDGSLKRIDIDYTSGHPIESAVQANPGKYSLGHP